MTLTLEQRREIAATLMDRAFAENPNWSVVPIAKQPASLAGVSIAVKQVANLPIKEPALSILAGTLTGDTSLVIDKGYANARFKVRHSTQQYSWFAWKYRYMLKTYSLPTSVIFSEPDGYQLKAKSKIQGVPIHTVGSGANLAPLTTVVGKLQLSSKVHPDLTALYRIICPSGKKELSRSWLNHMTDYYLMTVWLDDGGLSTGNGRQGRFSLEAWSLKEQNVFRQYLKVVWGIETTHLNIGRFMENGLPVYKIDIADLDNLMKLLRIIAPIVPVKEMLYKVCLMPKDKGLLQRWRSELLGLVQPQFVDYVNDYYNTHLG